MTTFAIADVVPGKLNALVKNIMSQTNQQDPNEAVRLVNSGEWVVQKVGVKVYTQRIFTDKVIEVHTPLGVQTQLIDATEVFSAGIYNAKRRTGTGKVSAETVLAVRLAEVHEMILDGTYKQVFVGFKRPLKDLCWGEEEIVAFCRDSRNHEYLCTGGFGTFFLFEGEDGGFFVALVIVYGGGRLGVFVGPLEHSDVWFAKYRHRIIVPQL